MGNFEKLGILVIIILVVVMVVLMGWGMSVPEVRVQAEETPRELSRDTSNGSGRAADPEEVALPGPHDDVARGVDPAEEDDPAYPHPDPEGPIPEPSDPNPSVREDIRHTVQKGDSYWSIAEKYYGHGKHMRVIQKANPGLSASALTIGKSVVVPHPEKVLGGGNESARVDPPEPEAADPGGARRYTVKKGESLWGIAQREYGNGSEWRRIAAANPGLDPDHIGEGDRINLPR